MNKRYLYPKGWEKIRVIIRVRDNFTCTICGIHESKLVSKNGKPLTLHCMHLDGNTFNNKYVLVGEIFNNPDNNLASGCPFCHKLYDRQHHNTEHVKYKPATIVKDLSNLIQLILGSLSFSNFAGLRPTAYNPIGLFS